MTKRKQAEMPKRAIGIKKAGGDEAGSEAECERGCGATGLHARKPLLIDTQDKARHVRRLRRAEGQVRGILRMVEEDRYCADILVQVAAARQSLQAVARELLNSHIQHCVADAIKTGGPEAEESLAELRRLVEQITRS